MSYPEVAHGTERRSLLKRFMWPLIALLVLAAAGLTVTFVPLGSSSRRVTDVPTAPVRKGPLTISVIQSGSVRSAQAVVLKNEVEGRTTVLWVIDEGTHVKAGDLLIELDASALADRKVDQEIRVQNSKAAFIQARETLEIVKKQAEADISAAELARDFAEQDLNNYEDSDFAQTKRKLEADLALARSDLQRNEDKAKWSEKLQKEGYITVTELQADLAALQKSKLDVELATEALNILKKFTYNRKTRELKRDLEQKTFLVAKAKHVANSNTVNAEAALTAADALFKRETDRLEKINDQIAKCKIKAPVDGMVVYATTGRMTRSNEEPLQQGTEVREQQELIRLPTAKEMIADVKVHESLLEKVRIGLPVRITTEALPGRTFGGRVSKISLLPDATSSYLNPDLKVYNTEIAIDGDAEDMRPGMSCSAEIIIDQLPEAVYVPVQSVMRVAGKPTVWVLPPNAEKPVAKAIETGMDNNRFIVVTSGLQVGEQVLLAPPLPASSVRESRLVSKPPGGSTPSTGSGKSIVKPDKSAADAPAPKTPKVKVAN